MQSHYSYLSNIDCQSKNQTKSDYLSPSRTGYFSPTSNTPPTPGRDWSPVSDRDKISVSKNYTEKIPAASQGSAEGPPPTDAREKTPTSEDSREKAKEALSEYMKEDKSDWDPTTGPVHQDTKDLIDNLWTVPITRLGADEVYKTLMRPSNLDVLAKTKINPEVESYKEVKQVDTDLAAIHWCNQFAATALTQLLDQIFKKPETPTRQEIIHTVTPALQILGRNANLINDLRRARLKPFTDAKYASGLLPEKGQFKYLFSDNLVQRMQKVSEEVDVVKELFPKKNTNNQPLNSSRGGRRNRGPPRARSRAGNRRHQDQGSRNQSRGRGKRNLSKGQSQKDNQKKS